MVLQNAYKQCMQQCAQQCTQQCYADVTSMLACASWHAPVLPSRLLRLFGVACNASLSCLLWMLARSSANAELPEFVHSLATSDLHVKEHYRADRSSLDEDIQQA
eukprot:1158620-Pelagomonas_calceolata.AAC.3